MIYGSALRSLSKGFSCPCSNNTIIPEPFYYHGLIRKYILAASKKKKVNMSESNNPNQKIIDEFRANGGKVGGWWGYRPMLLLHTIGAKTGQERVNPVATFQDGDRWVVIASKGGAPTHP
ncbi:MAG TPA: nitroreductase/quinone reductase family protein, partial [Anaerolineales bacterium]|nr:nitroreductase/quinone reductase family protein [Anaerolineales bacterium]